MGNGVAVGVGSGVAVAVGRGVAVGFGVAVGGIGVGSGVAVGCGVALGAGVSVGTTVAVGTSVLVGATVVGTGVDARACVAGAVLSATTGVVVGGMTGSPASQASIPIASTTAAAAAIIRNECIIQLLRNLKLNLGYFPITLVDVHPMSARSPLRWR